MYVVRVFQGAVCFQKDTYYDWATAVCAFGDTPSNIYTHIVLEIYLDDFTETWVRLAPFPSKWKGSEIWKGGEKND